MNIQAIAGPVHARRVHLDPPQVFHLSNWAQLSDAQRVAFMRRVAEASSMDPRIRATAIQVLRDAGVPDRDYAGQAKALLAWVQQNISYANENREVIQDPLYTLKTRQGDCDDEAVLLNALFATLRLSNRFVLSGTARDGTKVRWIEGTPVIPGVTWSHVYTMVGNTPFKPTAWKFAEPTLRGAPLGWDVIQAGARQEQSFRAVLPEMAGLGAFWSGATDLRGLLDTLGNLGAPRPGSGGGSSFTPSTITRTTSSAPANMPTPASSSSSDGSSTSTSTTALTTSALSITRPSSPWDSSTGPAHSGTALRAAAARKRAWKDQGPPRHDLKNAAFNLRETVKELLLLEDHLAKSDQRCLDCIRKHTLKVEALAEEAKGLDEAEAWRGVASWLANQARAIGAAAEQGQELAQLAQGVRTVRKKVVKALESTGENMAGVYGALGFYGAAGPGAAGSAVASAVATDAGAGAGVNWRNVFLGITVGVVTAVVSQVVLDKVRGRRRGSAA